MKHMTPYQSYTRGFLHGIMLALPIFAAGIAHAETPEEYRKRYTKELLKQYEPETMACSASSNAVLSYAEQLKEYNKMVRSQLAAQGIGVSATKVIEEDEEVTPEMIRAYARGDRDIFKKKTAAEPDIATEGVSVPEQVLPGAETRQINGARVATSLETATPQMAHDTLNALTSEAIQKSANPNAGIDKDGIPEAYSPFFDLNPAMREQYRKARALNLTPGPVIIDPSMALKQIAAAQGKQPGIVGALFAPDATHPDSGGVISRFLMGIRRALSRL